MFVLPRKISIILPHNPAVWVYGENSNADILVCNIHEDRTGHRQCGDEVSDVPVGVGTSFDPGRDGSLQENGKCR